MTDSDLKLNEVPSLVEERDRYEAWLEALDARRDTTPKHVFERVQTDYRERLRRVEQELVRHRQSIQEEQASLESRLSLLQAEEQLRRDERAELELRAHVGELAGTEADEAFHAVDEVIDKLVAEKAELSRRATALATLLERRPRAGTTPTPVPKRVEPVVPSAPPPAAEKVEPRSAAPAASGGSFDELAFLNKVVGEKERQGQTAAQRPPTTQKAPAPQPTQPAAPRPAAAQPPPAQAATAQTAAPAKQSAQAAMATPDEPVISDSLLSGLGDAPRRSAGEAPFAANVPANTPIVLRTVTAAEQSKTLKCGECGTMNYPTEWYCERCGAELAAL